MIPIITPSIHIITYVKLQLKHVALVGFSIANKPKRHVFFFFALWS